jgi:hypothetical protein
METGQIKKQAQSKCYFSKVTPEKFQSLKSGETTFEIRKNDKSYKVGDTLFFQEFNKTENGFGLTGNVISLRVCQTSTGFNLGVKPGYVVLGLNKIIDQ